jgi:hypothetical protein
VVSKEEQLVKIINIKGEELFVSSFKDSINEVICDNKGAFIYVLTGSLLNMISTKSMSLT